MFEKDLNLAQAQERLTGREATPYETLASIKRNEEFKTTLDAVTLPIDCTVVNLPDAAIAFPMIVLLSEENCPAPPTVASSSPL